MTFKEQVSQVETEQETRKNILAIDGATLDSIPRERLQAEYHAVNEFLKNIVRMPCCDSDANFLAVATVKEAETVLLVMQKLDHIANGGFLIDEQAKAIDEEAFFRQVIQSLPEIAVRKGKTELGQAMYNISNSSAVSFEGLRAGFAKYNYTLHGSNVMIDNFESCGAGDFVLIEAEVTQEKAIVVLQDNKLSTDESDLSVAKARDLTASLVLSLKELNGDKLNLAEKDFLALHEKQIENFLKGPGVDHFDDADILMDAFYTGRHRPVVVGVPVQKKDIKS